MNHLRVTKGHHFPTGFCEIRLQGHLNESWSERFDGVCIARHDDGTSLLTCEIVDQSALHGLLKRIRDLGIPLLAVNFVLPDQKSNEEVER